MRGDKGLQVDRIASALVKHFNASYCWEYFCKCGWKLTEDEIWANVEKSHKPQVESPLRYFIALCEVQMAKKEFLH